MNITQRRKILDRETDAVEQGDLARIIAPVGVAAQHLPEFRDGIVRTHLLNLALDPRLRLEFDKGARARQYVAVEFGLARTVATDRVDVDSRADHIVGKDGRIGLVGGAGGDDVGALDRLLRGRATGDAKPAARKIPGGLGDRKSTRLNSSH